MSKKEKPQLGMSDFGIARKANEGVKLPLALPDGTETDHYLVVRGADSARFRGARAKYNRELVKSLKTCKDDPERQERLESETRLKMVASLVADWSFPEDCNELNVCKFLADAPPIEEQVDSFAGVRSNFFVKPPQG